MVIERYINIGQYMTMNNFKVKGKEQQDYVKQMCANYLNYYKLSFHFIYNHYNFKVKGKEQQDYVKQ